MKPLPQSVWLDLLGKPWQRDARGPHAFDCVGLLLELMRRLGMSLPAYASRLPDLQLALACWERVTEPRPGDGILFHSINPPWHIAVVTGDGWMIHASERTGQVVRERYNAFPWHKHIEGFYRWKQDSCHASTMT